MSSSILQETTLCYLIQKDNILLAMKKRGFGEGKWNGVGGKVLENESVEKAAKRESNEEIGIEVIDMKKVAELLFMYPEDEILGENVRVHVYFCSQWKGTPSESEEMKPKWFSKKRLPMEKMWEDDIHWIPRVLQGETLKAEFIFDKSKKLQNHTIQNVAF